MPLVTDLDYSDDIAVLPKHAGYTVLPARAGEQYVTIHYSGVDYLQTDRNGELRRILDESRYQLGHNYGTATAPAYPDGLLYDVVILSDGTRVRTRANPQQLWHCGNAIGNRVSWAVHLMLGPKQDATAAQWAAAVNVIEQMCFMCNISRSNVVGHNEWPRHDGAPVPSATYKLLPEQSECPGKFLHQRLADWRALPVDPLKAHQIPGAHGAYFSCGSGFYDYYYAKVGDRDGLWELGYPEEHEMRAVGTDGRDCTKMRFQRGCLKYVEGEGVRPALSSEVKAQGW